MRKLSMKRKSRTPNSETSDTKDDERSGDENVDSPPEQDEDMEAANGPSKKSKKNKKSLKSSGEENGTDKKSPKKNAVKKDEEEEQYEVEAVLDEKMMKGARHYLIRWKGYDEDSDTWEPESTLSCPEIIAKYLTEKDSGAEPSKKNQKRGKSTDDKSNKKKKRSEGGDEKPDDVYEVDKIIEVHHKRNGQREFLVHWKGYTNSDNTWEPEDNMNCPDLIEKFMAKVNKARTVDTRELRVNRMPTARFTLSMTQTGRKLSRRNLGKQRVHYHDNE